MYKEHIQETQEKLESQTTEVSVMNKLWFQYEIKYFSSEFTSHNIFRLRHINQRFAEHFMSSYYE